MKPQAPTLTRHIEWKPKLALSIHEAVTQTPEDRALVELLVSEWQGKLARGTDPARLIHDPLQVSPENEIEDGRHRWLAALRIDAIHSLPCEVTDGADPAALVCEKLLQRRHYSKSARAYSLRHLAAAAAAVGREARAGNLKIGARSPIADAIGNRETLESLALKSGLSRDILEQAVKLERDYMTRADALLIDWLAINPEEAAAWQVFQDGNPLVEMPWGCWRATRLAALGVPDDAKSVNVIPRAWREIEEDKIFNGIQDPDGEPDDRRSYSLGSSIKALGSIFATAGAPRPDLDAKNPDLATTLANKVRSFGKTMFAQWDTVAQADRLGVIKTLAESVTSWPEDARRGLLVSLAKETPSKPRAVLMTPVMLTVLAAVEQYERSFNEPADGLGLSSRVNATVEATNGATDNLVELGFLSVTRPGRSGLPVYRVTDAGRALLAELNPAPTTQEVAL